MGGGQGLERRIRDIVLSTAPCYVEIAQIVSISVDGRIAEGITRPGGREFDARIVYFGLNSKGGIFVPLEADDEVLVLFPSGKANNAVVLAGMGSLRAPVPPLWPKDRIWLVNPNGVEARTQTLLPAGSVPNKQFLTDLSGVLDDIIAAATAAGSSSVNTAAFKTALGLGTYDTKGIKSD